MEVAEGVVEPELEVAEFEGKSSGSDFFDVPLSFVCIHPGFYPHLQFLHPSKVNQTCLERHMRGAEIARNFYSCPDSSSHMHLSHLRLVPIFG